MRFQCSFCLFIITADDSFIGDSQRPKISCPNCGKTVFIPTHRFEEGCVIADFCIQRKIGEGSIGAVYEAIQISLNRKVALKILYEEYTNVKGVTDFIKEARVIAQLNHANLVQCYAVGEENGICFMAMDYIKGESVKTKLRKDGVFPLDEALHVIQQVAEALYYAWDEAELIHRDVKPDNIMINDEGIVKLTDLGLAISRKDWSEDMEISGSPSYMSPEQFSGERLDSRCDIYSLGVTLYQMLSGRLPFEGETIKTISEQHFYQPAVPLNQIDPKIPVKVVELVEKMMAKHPDDRFQSQEDLLNAVWLVRQRTAPNRELVPDVHTISMKRLDYELQKETARRQEEVSKSIYGILLKIVLVVLLVLGVAGGIIFLIYRNSKNSYLEQRNKVEAIGLYLRSEDMDPDYIQSRIQEIMIRYQHPKKPEDHEIRAKLQFYLEQIRNFKLTRMMSKLKEKMAALEKKNSELQKSLESFSENGKLREEREAKLRERHLAAITQLTDIKTELQVLKKKNSKSSEQLKKLKEFCNNYAFDALRFKTYLLIKAGKFKKALSLVKAESEKSEFAGFEGFRKYAKKLKHLENLRELISDSGSKLATVKVRDYGKIVAIKNGKILYQDEAKQIREKEWRDFPTSVLLEMIMTTPEYAELDEAEVKQLKAEIYLLRGNLAKAQELVPDSNYIVNIYAAVKSFDPELLSRSGVKKKRKSKLVSKSESRRTARLNISEPGLSSVIKHKSGESSSADAVEKTGQSNDIPDISEIQ